MTDEKRRLTDAEYRAACDADPLAVFNTLADLRRSGTNPVDVGLVPHNPVTKKVKAADRWAKQQVDSAIAAAGKWQDGVMNPSRDPIAAGIEADDKWKNAMKTAMDQDRRKKGLQATSTAELQAVVTKLGSGVYSSGVEARTAKVQKVVNQLQPLAQSVSDAVQGMSDKTYADRTKRLLAARDLMIAVGQKRRG